MRAQAPLEPSRRRRLALPRGEQTGALAQEPRGERAREEDRGGRASAIDERPELQARRRARRDSAVQRTRRRARTNVKRFDVIRLSNAFAFRARLRHAVEPLLHVGADRAQGVRRRVRPDRVRGQRPACRGGAGRRIRRRRRFHTRRRLLRLSRRVSRRVGRDRARAARGLPPRRRARARGPDRRERPGRDAPLEGRAAVRAFVDESAAGRDLDEALRGRPEFRAMRETAVRDNGEQRRGHRDLRRVTVLDPEG